MEQKKEKKKGFWASLFAPKSCSCSCNENTIVEVNEAEAKTSACSCGSCEENASSVKEIKVLGTGCAKCKTTFGVVERVVKENGLDVRLTKVEDMAEIMSYNIISTPAVVVDEKVIIKGHVPSEQEVKKILGL